MFKKMYGEIPWYNDKGDLMKPRDEFEYFTYDAVEKVLRHWRSRTSSTNSYQKGQACIIYFSVLACVEVARRTC